MQRFVSVLLVAVLVMPAAVFAQSSQSAAQGGTVDASKLGVSLERIRRELVEAETEAASDSPLRLRFTVQVIGIAPKIDFLQGFPVEGPIPYGAPTHQEVLEVLTPKEYRSGAVPIYGLAMVAAQKLFQYSKKRRCEAEIEEYRQLVMQGVAVAAPTCSQ